MIALSQEESCVIDYEILEFPPAQELKHDFWHDVVGEPVDIQAHLSLWPKVEDTWKLLCRRPPSFSIYVKDRAPEEKRFLSELYTEGLERESKNVPFPKDFDLTSPTPPNFGLASFEPYPDLIERLVAYEDRLSPGSLRDVVHVVGVMRKLYYAEAQVVQERLVEDLLQWLDALPEIERRCLADTIISSTYQWYRDEPAINRLVYEAIQRQPKTLYEFRDYREYRLSQFYRPGFQEYLKQRKQAERNP
jgi:hypothetical protein